MTNEHSKKRARGQDGIHSPEGPLRHLPLHIGNHGITYLQGCEEHVGQFVPFEGAKEEQPHERVVLFVTLEKLVSKKFQKSPGGARLSQLLYLYIVFVTLMGLLFQNRAIELGLVREITENNGFVDGRL